MNQAKVKELHALAICVAHALQANRDCSEIVWTAAPYREDTWQVYLENRENKARIYLTLTGRSYENPDRVEVSGWLHIGKDGSYVEVRDKSYNRVTVDAITVALARGPEAIAKEIARRFLPEYLLVFALAQEIVRKDAKYAALITAGLQRLAKAAGTELPTKDKWQREVRSAFTFSIGKVYGCASA